MKQRLKEWLNIKVGTEQPKDAMEAHQLAKHYFHVARRQKMFGSDCTENMTLAKKFFEQYKELKRGGDSSDNDSLEEVDVDDEIDNFSEDINEAGYKRPAVAARNRDIARKSSKLRGRESVSSKTTTMFKKRHGGKTVANRPGTEGVPRSTGATGDKRALGGQGAILQDLHNMPEDEFRRKYRKSKSAARTMLRNEEVSLEAMDPDARAAAVKYLSRRPSAKRREAEKQEQEREKKMRKKAHDNPVKPGAASNVKTEPSRSIGTQANRKLKADARSKYLKPPGLGAVDHRKAGMYSTNLKRELRDRHGSGLRREEHLPENSITVSMHSSGTKYKVHGVHKSIKGQIKPGEHLSDTHIDDLRDSGIKIRHVKPKPVVKEDDEGWYTHREIHGDKGVSKADWKKGIRLNLRTGKKVDTTKKPAVKKIPYAGFVKKTVTKEEEGQQSSIGTPLKHKRSWNPKTHKLIVKKKGMGVKVVPKSHPGMEAESVVDESGMSRVAYQKQSGEKGSGVKTFKKKPPSKKVKEYGVEKERELAAKGDRYEEVEPVEDGFKAKYHEPPKADPKTGLTPRERHKMTPEWAAMLKRHGERKKMRSPERRDAALNRLRGKVNEHAPEVVEYTPYAYDYNRKAWEESLAEVNRYKGRSGHRVTRPEKEEPEHIIMQMRKVQSLQKNHSGVEFHDGTKVKIKPGHAAQVIARHDGAKPAEKENIARTASHSHAGLQHVASGKPIDDKSPGAQKKPMFKAAARREPLRRVRHPDDE